MALPKKQNKRLGAILSVMFQEETPQEHLEDIVKDGYVAKEEEGFAITPKGLDEKNRLCTLAGLNIKYQSERGEDKTG